MPYEERWWERENREKERNKRCYESEQRRIELIRVLKRPLKPRESWRPEDLEKAQRRKHE